MAANAMVLKMMCRNSKAGNGKPARSDGPCQRASASSALGSAGGKPVARALAPFSTVSKGE